MTADINGQPTLDLNSYDQEFSYASIFGSGIKAVKDSSGAGTLSFLDHDYNGDYVMGIEDGTFLVQAGNVYCEKYVYLRNNSSLIVTGGTFTCDLELMPGHAGAAGTVTVSDIGVVSAYVCRNGDVDDASTFNLNTGGTLQTGVMKADGTGLPETSYLNFDGGTLSDGGWPDWNNSYTNWIQVFTNLIVKVGGAKIEVNNINGRRIVPPLMHDSALGGTLDGGLTKIGGQTLTLAGNNTYTGPTDIQAGTLLINGSINNSSGISISSGAKLGGTGTLPGMTFPSGAIVTPGTSIGTLSFAGSVVMSAGSEYDWEVGDPVSADLMDVTGSFTIPGGGMTVNAIDAGSPDGSTYTLVQTTAGIVGDPADITMNYGAGVAGTAAYVSGDDLVADVVPEPAFLGLIVLGALALIRRK